VPSVHLDVVLCVRSEKATLIADFADAAIDRGHCHSGRLSFGRSPSLPRVHVRDDRVE